MDCKICDKTGRDRDPGEPGNLWYGGKDFSCNIEKSKQVVFWNLEIGIYLNFGTWNLEFNKAGLGSLTLFRSGRAFFFSLASRPDRHHGSP